ncbi:MAG TPA: transglutaminase domain-containing protein, partial [Gemmata sp.]|nr:transglutaminase domain-containing protein [Gemmata sp.]
VYNVPRIKEYSDNLIRAMIEKGTLPLDCRDRISLLPRRDFHFEIAHAFSQHLATSAEFRYTTKLRRERKDVDPVEEFLFHTRSGHCERFASALVLLLRSQGIPAVLVLGFKGCEPTEQPGSYVVRQAHAHAWVETLVQAPGQSPNALIRDCVYHWLSLDPTPPSPPDEHAQQENGSLGQVGSWVRSLYKDYVANYTPEKRRKALAAIGGWFTRPEVLAGIAAGIGLIVLAQRWSRRLRVAATSESQNPLHVQWFGKLLQILAGRGFVPLPGQTSREFALEVSQTLCLRPETMGVSRVPLDWADAYYEVRFGGGTIAPDEQGKLEHGLAELKRVLETMPREAGGEESR